MEEPTGLSSNKSKQQTPKSIEMDDTVRHLASGNSFTNVYIKYPNIFRRHQIYQNLKGSWSPRKRRKMRISNNPFLPQHHTNHYKTTKELKTFDVFSQPLPFSAKDIEKYQRARRDFLINLSRSSLEVNESCEMGTNFCAEEINIEKEVNIVEEKEQDSDEETRKLDSVSKENVDNIQFVSNNTVRKENNLSVRKPGHADDVTGHVVSTDTKELEKDPIIEAFNAANKLLKESVAMKSVKFHSPLETSRMCPARLIHIKNGCRNETLDFVDRNIDDGQVQKTDKHSYAEAMLSYFSSHDDPVMKQTEIKSLTIGDNVEARSKDITDETASYCLEMPLYYYQYLNSYQFNSRNESIGQDKMSMSNSDHQMKTMSYILNKKEEKNPTIDCSNNYGKEQSDIIKHNGREVCKELLEFHQEVTQRLSSHYDIPTIPGTNSNFNVVCGGNKITNSTQHGAGIVSQLIDNTKPNPTRHFMKYYYMQPPDRNCQLFDKDKCESVSFQDNHKEISSHFQGLPKCSTTQSHSLVKDNSTISTSLQQSTDINDTRDPTLRSRIGNRRRPNFSINHNINNKNNNNTHVTATERSTHTVSLTLLPIPSLPPSHNISTHPRSINSPSLPPPFTPPNLHPAPSNDTSESSSYYNSSTYVNTISTQVRHDHEGDGIPGYHPSSPDIQEGSQPGEKCLPGRENQSQSEMNPTRLIKSSPQPNDNHHHHHDDDFRHIHPQVQTHQTIPPINFETLPPQPFALLISTGQNLITNYDDVHDGTQYNSTLTPSLDFGEISNAQESDTVQHRSIADDKSPIVQNRATQAFQINPPPSYFDSIHELCADNSNDCGIFSPFQQFDNVSNFDSSVDKKHSGSLNSNNPKRYDFGEFVDSGENTNSRCSDTDCDTALELDLSINNAECDDKENISSLMLDPGKDCDFGRVSGNDALLKPVVGDGSGNRANIIGVNGIDTTGSELYVGGGVIVVPTPQKSPKDYQDKVAVRIAREMSQLIQQCEKDMELSQAITATPTNNNTATNEIYSIMSTFGTQDGPDLSSSDIINDTNSDVMVRMRHRSDKAKISNGGVRANAANGPLKANHNIIPSSSHDREIMEINKNAPNSSKLFTKRQRPVNARPSSAIQAPSRDLTDDTDPRIPTPMTTVDIDDLNEPIRPRSSSRRRAYIIKRPQSAPLFGRITPRPFPPNIDTIVTTDESSSQHSQYPLKTNKSNVHTNHAISSLKNLDNSSQKTLDNTDNIFQQCGTSFKCVALHENVIKDDKVCDTLMMVNQKQHGDSCVIKEDDSTLHVFGDGSDCVPIFGDGSDCVPILGDGSDCVTDNTDEYVSLKCNSFGSDFGIEGDESGIDRKERVTVKHVETLVILSPRSKSIELSLVNGNYDAISNLVSDGNNTHKVPMNKMSREKNQDIETHYDEQNAVENMIYNEPVSSQILTSPTSNKKTASSISHQIRSPSSTHKCVASSKIDDEPDEADFFSSVVSASTARSISPRFRNSITLQMERESPLLLPPGSSLDDVDVVNENEYNSDDDTPHAELPVNLFTTENSSTNNEIIENIEMSSINSFDVSETSIGKEDDQHKSESGDVEETNKRTSHGFTPSTYISPETYDQNCFIFNYEQHQNNDVNFHQHKSNTSENYVQNQMESVEMAETDTHIDENNTEEWAERVVDKATFQIGNIENDLEVKDMDTSNPQIGGVEDDLQLVDMDESDLQNSSLENHSKGMDINMSGHIEEGPGGSVFIPNLRLSSLVGEDTLSDDDANINNFNPDDVCDTSSDAEYTNVRDSLPTSMETILEYEKHIHALETEAEDDFESFKESGMTLDLNEILDDDEMIEGYRGYDNPVMLEQILEESNISVLAENVTVSSYSEEHSFDDTCPAVDVEGKIDKTDAETEKASELSNDIICSVSDLQPAHEASKFMFDVNNDENRPTEYNDEIKQNVSTSTEDEIEEILNDADDIGFEGNADRIPFESIGATSNSSNELENIIGSYNVSCRENDEHTQLDVHVHSKLSSPSEPATHSDDTVETTLEPAVNSVKKRSPFKRFFARKKGKYNPSKDFDTATSVLPTLEDSSTKDSAKKSKSFSPPPTTEKKPKKSFVKSAQSVNLVDGTPKKGKEKKVKEKKEKDKGVSKFGKIDKSNIVVIKSSGKSLLDSLVDVTTNSDTLLNQGEQGSCPSSENDEVFNHMGPIVQPHDVTNRTDSDVGVHHEYVNIIEGSIGGTSGSDQDESLSNNGTQSHSKEDNSGVDDSVHLTNHGSTYDTNRSVPQKQIDAKQEERFAELYVNTAVQPGDVLSSSISASDKSQSQSQDSSASLPPRRINFDDISDSSVTTNGTDVNLASRVYSETYNCSNIIMNTSQKLCDESDESKSVNSDKADIKLNESIYSDPPSDVYDKDFTITSKNNTDGNELLLRIKDSDASPLFTNGIGGDNAEGNIHDTTETKECKINNDSDIETIDGQCVKPQTKLSSIETTESDNETDETLLAMAAEFPLNRPKYGKGPVLDENGSIVKRHQTSPDTHDQSLICEELTQQNTNVMKDVLTHKLLNSKKLLRDRVECGDVSMETLPEAENPNACAVVGMSLDSSHETFLVSDNNVKVEHSLPQMWDIIDDSKVEGELDNDIDVDDDDGDADDSNDSPNVISKETKSLITLHRSPSQVLVLAQVHEPIHLDDSSSNLSVNNDNHSDSDNDEGLVYAKKSPSLVANDNNLSSMNAHVNYLNNLSGVFMREDSIELETLEIQHTSGTTSSDGGNGDHEKDTLNCSTHDASQSKRLNIDDIEHMASKIEANASVSKTRQETKETEDEVTSSMLKSVGIFNDNDDGNQVDSNRMNEDEDVTHHRTDHSEKKQRCTNSEDEVSNKKNSKKSEGKPEIPRKPTITPRSSIRLKGGKRFELSPKYSNDDSEDEFFIKKFEDDRYQVEDEIIKIPLEMSSSLPKIDDIDDGRTLRSEYKEIKVCDPVNVEEEEIIPSFCRRKFLNQRDCKRALNTIGQQSGGKELNCEEDTGCVSPPGEELSKSKMDGGMVYNDLINGALKDLDDFVYHDMNDGDVKDESEMLEPKQALIEKLTNCKSLEIDNLEEVDCYKDTAESVEDLIVKSKKVIKNHTMPGLFCKPMNQCHEDGVDNENDTLGYDDGEDMFHYDKASDIPDSDGVGVIVKTNKGDGHVFNSIVSVTGEVKHMYGKSSDEDDNVSDAIDIHNSSSQFDDCPKINEIIDENDTCNDNDQFDGISHEKGTFEEFEIPFENTIGKKSNDLCNSSTLGRETNETNDNEKIESGSVHEYGSVSGNDTNITLDEDGEKTSHNSKIDVSLDEREMYEEMGVDSNQTEGPNLTGEIVDIDKEDNLAIPPIPIGKKRQQTPLCSDESKDNSTLSATVLEECYEEVVDKIDKDKKGRNFSGSNKSYDDVDNDNDDGEGGAKDKKSEFLTPKKSFFPWRKKNKENSPGKHEKAKSKDKEKKVSVSKIVNKTEKIKAENKPNTDVNSKLDVKPKPEVKPKPKVDKLKKQSKDETCGKSDDNAQQEDECEDDTYHEIEENQMEPSNKNDNLLTHGVVDDQNDSSQSDYELVNYIDGEEANVGEELEFREEKGRNQLKNRLMTKLRDSDSLGYEVPAPNEMKSTKDNKKNKKKDKKRKKKDVDNDKDRKKNNKSDSNEDSMTSNSFESVGEKSISEENKSQKSRMTLTQFDDEGFHLNEDDNCDDIDDSITPYLTFQYPRFIDGGEIYVDSPLSSSPDFATYTQEKKSRPNSHAIQSKGLTSVDQDKDSIESETIGAKTDATFPILSFSPSLIRKDEVSLTEALAKAFPSMSGEFTSDVKDDTDIDNEGNQRDDSLDRGLIHPADSAPDDDEWRLGHSHGIDTAVSMTTTSPSNMNDENDKEEMHKNEITSDEQKKEQVAQNKDHENKKEGMEKERLKNEGKGKDKKKDKRIWKPKDSNNEQPEGDKNKNKTDKKKLFKGGFFFKRFEKNKKKKEESMGDDVKIVKQMNSDPGAMCDVKPVHIGADSLDWSGSVTSSDSHSVHSSSSIRDTLESKTEDVGALQCTPADTDNDSSNEVFPTYENSGDVQSQSLHLSMVSTVHATVGDQVKARRSSQISSSSSSTPPLYAQVRKPSLTKSVSLSVINSNDEHDENEQTKHYRFEKTVSLINPNLDNTDDSICSDTMDYSAATRNIDISEDPQLVCSKETKDVGKKAPNLQALFASCHNDNDSDYPNNKGHDSTSLTTESKADTSFLINHPNVEIDTLESVNSKGVVGDNDEEEVEYFTAFPLDRPICLRQNVNRNDQASPNSDRKQSSEINQTDRSRSDDSIGISRGSACSHDAADWVSFKPPEESQSMVNEDAWKDYSPLEMGQMKSEEQTNDNDNDVVMCTQGDGTATNSRSNEGEVTPRASPRPKPASRTLSLPPDLPVPKTRTTNTLTRLPAVRSNSQVVEASSSSDLVGVDNVDRNSLSNSSHHFRDTIGTSAKTSLFLPSFNYTDDEQDLAIKPKTKKFSPGSDLIFNMSNHINIPAKQKQSNSARKNIYIVQDDDDDDANNDDDDIDINNVLDFQDTDDGAFGSASIDGDYFGVNDKNHRTASSLLRNSSSNTSSSSATIKDEDEDKVIEDVYDHLPVRMRQTKPPTTKFPPFQPVVPPNYTSRKTRPASIEYTGIKKEHSHAEQRGSSTVYASPWKEEDIVEQLTPKLPPRQYRRHESEAIERIVPADGSTNIVLQTTQSRLSLTSVDLGSDIVDRSTGLEVTGPVGPGALRKAISLGYGLDDRERRKTLDKKKKEKAKKHGGGEQVEGKEENVKKAISFRALTSLFRRKKSKNGRKDDKGTDQSDDPPGDNWQLQKSIEQEFDKKSDQTKGKGGSKDKNKTGKSSKPEKAEKSKSKGDKVIKSAPSSIRDKGTSSHDKISRGSSARPVCRLVRVNEDETRVVELTRHRSEHLGVLFAKGEEIGHEDGLFINCFQDKNTSKLFSGILCIGDEVLDIDGQDVHYLTLEEVKDIIGLKDKMTLRIMPSSVARSSL